MTMLNRRASAPQKPVPRTSAAAIQQAMKASSALKTGYRSLIHEIVDIAWDTLY